MLGSFSLAESFSASSSTALLLRESLNLELLIEYLPFGDMSDIIGIMLSACFSSLNMKLLLRLGESNKESRLLLDSFFCKRLKEVLRSFSFFLISSPLRVLLTKSLLVALWNSMLSPQLDGLDFSASFLDAFQSVGVLSVFLALAILARL